MGNKLIYIGGFDGLGVELSSVDSYTAITNSLNNREEFITGIEYKWLQR